MQRTPPPSSHLPLSEWQKEVVRGKAKIESRTGALFYYYYYWVIRVCSHYLTKPCDITHMAVWLLLIQCKERSRQNQEGEGIRGEAEWENCLDWS